MTRQTLWASTALFALSTPLAAQQAFELDEITVSGSLSPVRIDESGSSVDVLLADDLDRADTNVMQTLSRLPGVSATSKGGLGGAELVQLRGLPARYAGVRINGIDVADPSGVQVQYDFAGLTSSGLDRIEVLRGSQSALYGSEAIGGLVDITTFRPTDRGFSGNSSLEYGAHDTTVGALNLGYATARGEVALTYGVARSNGFSAKADNTEDDGFDQDMVTLFGDYDINEDLSAGVSVYWRDRTADYDGTTVSDDVLSTEELGYEIFGEYRAGAATHRLSVSRFDVTRDDPTGFTSRFEGQRERISYDGHLDMAGGARLNFGAGVTEESFTSDAAAFNSAESNSRSVQAELLLNPANDVNVSAALRYDEDDDFGGQASGRVSVVWSASADMTLRASAGTGYRAPSLFERFGSSGNPNLQPEDSVTYELGVERTMGEAASLRATLFYTEIEDLIDYVPGSPVCSSPFGCYEQVPGATVSQGLEIAGHHRLTDTLTVHGSYTYTDATTEGDRLALTPRHDLAVGVEAEFVNGFGASFDLRHVADVEPSAFAPAGNKVDDYTLVGLGTRYDLTDTVEIRARVENLLDEDYETTGGFNTAGRSVYAGLSAQF